MQNRPGIDPTTEDPMEPARSWIGSLLQSIANRLGVKISGWHWQSDDTVSDTRECQLVVIGSHGKRVIKLFTTDELTHCLNDSELQSDILARLTQLVNFLGDRRNPRSGKNQGRKRCSN
jgi:hypothetical protein